MEAIELKLCPFCGSKAELREHWGDCSKRPSWYEVECLNPDCGRCQDTSQEAVTSWNTRAEADAEIARLEADVKRLKAVIKKIKNFCSNNGEEREELLRTKIICVPLVKLIKHIAKDALRTW